MSRRLLTSETDFCITIRQASTEEVTALHVTDRRPFICARNFLSRLSSVLYLTFFDRVCPRCSILGLLACAIPLCDQVLAWDTILIR